MKYRATNYEDALERAQFWYKLFILEWGGKSVNGEWVTSICVRKPCGAEVELMGRK